MTPAGYPVATGAQSPFQVPYGVTLVPVSSVVGTAPTVGSQFAGMFTPPKSTAEEWEFIPAFAYEDRYYPCIRASSLYSDKYLVTALASSDPSGGGLRGATGNRHRSFDHLLLNQYMPIVFSDMKHAKIVSTPEIVSLLVQGKQRWAVPCIVRFKSPAQLPNRLVVPIWDDDKSPPVNATAIYSDVDHDITSSSASEFKSKSSFVVVFGIQGVGANAQSKSVMGAILDANGVVANSFFMNLADQGVIDHVVDWSPRVATFRSESGVDCFVAAWVRFDKSNSTFSVIARLFDGLPGTPHPEIQVAAGAYCSVLSSVTVAATPRGFMVAWDDGQVQGAKAYTRSFSADGQALGNAEQLPSFGAGAWRPFVASCEWPPNREKKPYYIATWHVFTGSLWYPVGRVQANLGPGALVGPAFPIFSSPNSGAQGMNQIGFIWAEFFDMHPEVLKFGLCWHTSYKIDNTYKMAVRRRFMP